MSDTDLGLRIRRARERKRWSQQELADALGVGSRSVGRWERGEAVPRSSIGALEEVLGVNLDTDPDEVEFRTALARLRDNPILEGFDLTPLEHAFERKLHARRVSARGSTAIAS